ncbi:atlastin-1-like isoform X2 [Amblyomma americanum]
MAETPSFGRGVTLLTPKGKGSFKLDVSALEELLLADKVKNKPVVVVSVVGIFRKGKSFLLNFFIRYLRSRCQSDWLNEPNTVHDGFVWRGGSERETQGILLWNEVFLVVTPRGEEVAVVLMDTQGTFDRKSTTTESAKIFSLSALLSSVLIYNISQNIGEDDLQHLQLFCDYGCLVKKDVTGAPFQKLLFLVRDWSYPYEFEYGEKGGKQLLTKALQTSDEQEEQLRKLREDIRSSFEEIACFLLPYPGSQVATGPEYKGQLEEIDSSFLKHMEQLMLTVLHPRNLQPKRVNSVPVTCAELCTYFQVYAEAFKSGEIPDAKTMREATGAANNLSALTEALNFYVHEMNQFCSGTRSQDEANLSVTHRLLRDAAVKKFYSVQKLGGRDLEETYKERMLEAIDKTFQEFVKRNNDKQFQGDMTDVFRDLFLVVGTGILSIPFRSASLAARVMSFLKYIPGLGLPIASSVLSRLLGDAVAPVDNNPVNADERGLVHSLVTQGK